MCTFLVGIANGEVGLIEGILKVDDEEIVVWIKSFKICAFKITIVPSDISKSDSGLCCFSVGSVPVFVVSDEGGRAESDQGD